MDPLPYLETTVNDSLASQTLYQLKRGRSLVKRRRHFLFTSRHENRGGQVRRYVIESQIGVLAIATPAIMSSNYITARVLLEMLTAAEQLSTTKSWQTCAVYVILSRIGVVAIATPAITSSNYITACALLETLDRCRTNSSTEFQDPFLPLFGW